VTDHLSCANTCRVCGAMGEHPLFTAREMNSGTGESFRYFQCQACETLQIERIPENLEAHYPPTYYSFRLQDRHRFVRLFRHLRDVAVLTGNGVVGKLLNLYAQDLALTPLRCVAGLNPGSRILDIGCGEQARVLRRLEALGFHCLLGIDPYLQQDRVASRAIVLRRCQVEQVEGKFDVIMFHHSFEHIPDPRGALSAARTIIDPDGMLLIRIPTVSSYAWRRYGVNWAQLDAPRHLHLFSVRAMNAMAKASGFNVKSVAYDSTEFQFWGSEQISRGWPLSKKQHVAASAMRQYRREAVRLNRAEDGDSAAFLLEPA